MRLPAALKFEVQIEYPHDADGGDEQCAGGWLPVAIFVEEAVFAGDKGRAIGERFFVAAPVQADKRAEAVGQGWVAPTEVVEDGDAVGVGADGTTALRMASSMALIAMA